MPSIYLRGSAFDSSEGNETYLLVNGESRGMSQNRGLNTVILQPDGTAKAQTSHDVYSDQNLWNAWADWVNANAQTGDIVTVASFDAVNNAPWGGTADGLLKSIGAQTAFNVIQGTDWRMVRSPYVLLFVKGLPRALEVSQPHTGPNAHLSVQFAAIYQHNDYGGAGQALSAGQYNINDLLIGNDQLSSLRVPDGLQVTLYEHMDLQGNARTYTADAPSVGDFNDQASSILVEQVVTIYEHSDYQGQSKTLKIGHYNMADLGIGNDQLSSLKVPPGLKVTLFQHADFSGETRGYNANVAFTQDFNDQTSSIVVEQGPAPILL
ncbi:MAG TPA: beta/gamma crystallin-related protein, partial [Anaerolineales bacterium]|nr:beta/gamma crystallin-related protein [Anaerolineales bacterium]